MIEITPNFPSSLKTPLGRTCVFQIQKEAPDIETRSFIIQQNIFHLKPLSDWGNREQVTFFPEAVGDYKLLVQWRTAEGKTGWKNQPFMVVASIKNIPQPTKIKNDRRMSMWVTNGWEKAHFNNYELPVTNLLPRLISKGQVVYDIGANLGFYTVHFSRLVGPKGQVICFEPSPLCIYFLQANLDLNAVKNCLILPLAVSDQVGDLKFTINYENSAVGLAQPSHFYGGKIGHEITVSGYPLDELIEQFDLPIPDLVKIDVEGAEEYAVRGMKDTLSSHQPVLLIEIHGAQAARMTIPLLAENGYSYKVISTGAEFQDAESLLAWFPDVIHQLLCIPSAKRHT
jgi:FkbM family methyltransferase